MARNSDSQLTAEELRQVLDLVENSSFEELDLKLGDLHLSVSKNGSGRAARPEPETRPTTVVEVPTKEERRPLPVEASSPPAIEAGSGLIEITAPVVGIYYVAPEPGAPPFVEVGATVQPDTTVGLIEVMKVFNGVKSEVAGTIVRRLVEDSQFVEHGQPLFLVRPGGD